VTPREDAQTKARRLLAEGRVTLRHLEPDRIGASVRGDSACVYRVGWEPSGWHCDCAAVSIRCSHVRAVMLVVLEPTREPSSW
jgi:uncharacterized Zn finger protein